MNTVSEKEVSEEKTVETNSGINLPEQEIFDYKSLADKTEVLDSILSKKRKFTLKSAISAILLIISLLLLSPLSTKLSLDANVVFVINTVLLLIGICFNFDILKSIPYLFNSKTDVDLPFAAALLITFVQNIFCFASAKNAVPFTSVALLSLLFNNLAKKGRCSLLIKNFNLIANDDNKKAVCVVNNRAATKAMVGNAIEGEALVCCGVETKNINDFLKYSYCNDPTSKRIKNLTIVTCTFGFIFGLIAAIFNPSNIIYGINIFSAISLIAAAPTTLFAAYLPFKSAASRLSCYNAMLSGYKAANELDRCNALVVDCSELFPKGNIKLVDMKLLSPNPIDQSILDAEALAKAIGSPLYGLFSQVKNTSGTPTQPKVDSMVYEDKMGISGWVDDRRVFVGNRVLLESHGFTRLPPIELDKKIMRKGYFPIYLVSDNVPCAMFVVKYIPDEEIAYELHRLCNTGTTILINNCDPNISANMICDYFNLYKDTVSIMSKQGSEQYSIVSGFKENKSAGAAYDGSICGLMATLTAAINSKRLVSVMSVMNTIFSILGILGITVLTIMGSFSVISAVPLIVFQAITSLITLTIPEIYKP